MPFYKLLGSLLHALSQDILALAGVTEPANAPAAANDGDHDMPRPGVEIKTALNPILYSSEQINEACQVAWALQRGRFELCVLPEGDEHREDDDASR